MKLNIKSLKSAIAEIYNDVTADEQGTSNTLVYDIENGEVDFGAVPEQAASQWAGSYVRFYPDSFGEIEDGATGEDVAVWWVEMFAADVLQNIEDAEELKAEIEESQSQD